MRSNTQPERIIQNSILDLLIYNDVPYIIHDSMGLWDNERKIYRKRSKYYRLGVSDIIVFNKCNLSCLFLEVKTKTGKLSDNQKKFKKWIEGYGFKYYIVRSIDDAYRALKENRFKVGKFLTLT